MQIEPRKPVCKHLRKSYKLKGKNLKVTCLNCLWFELIPAVTEPGRWEDKPIKDEEGE
jgi:hypothetical protein